MVNAKNITLAALATTVVVAVVGVEVYNSGNYKTQVAFHGAGITAAEIYAESVQACGDVDRAGKGEKLNACIDNNKRTEMKWEMDSGIVVAMINDDVSMFTRTASGLVHVSDHSATEMKMFNGEDKDELDLDNVTQPTKVGNVIDFGNDVKIMVDEVATNPKPLDFSEERAASKRSLLASREGRQTFGRWYNRSWWKTMNKHWKKVKKKHKCAIRVVWAFVNFWVCFIAIMATVMTAAAFAWTSYLACGSFVFQLWQCTVHCGSDRTVNMPPTPSGFSSYLGDLDITDPAG